MELHKQIKKYRKALNLSQEELADQIYVTRQSISNWETDKNYPDIHSLILMSSLFNISLDELIKGDLEEMKREVKAEDIHTFYKQGKIFLCLLILTVLSIVPLVYFFELVGFFLWLIISSITLLYSLEIEKFKKDQDIQTYKEIVAFSKGERLDDIRKEQKKSLKPYQYFIKMICGAIFGFIVAYGMVKLFRLF